MADLPSVVAKRLLMIIPTILGLLVITFTLSYVIPSDPARTWAGLMASDETVDFLKERYHLDEPVYVQFYYYLNSLVRGDLGDSPVTKRSVVGDLMTFFPNTLELTLASLILALFVGISIGVFVSLRRGGVSDFTARVLSLTGTSMPDFWLALLFVMGFYVYLGVFPGGGVSSLPLPPRVTGLILVDSLLAGNVTSFTDHLYHLILPAVALAARPIGIFARLVRNSMLEVLSQDYIVAARAKGLPGKVIIYKHALKNALIPLVAISAMWFGWLLGGAVMIETVFSWPGIGRYAVYTAIQYVDYPAIMGVTLLGGLAFSFANLASDLVYTYLDPRVRV